MHPPHSSVGDGPSRVIHGRVHGVYAAQAAAAHFSPTSIISVVLSRHACIHY